MSMLFHSSIIERIAVNVRRTSSVGFQLFSHHYSEKTLLFLLYEIAHDLTATPIVSNWLHPVTPLSYVYFACY